jgi:hypothetical protein
VCWRGEISLENALLRSTLGTRAVTFSALSVPENWRVDSQCCVVGPAGLTVATEAGRDGENSRPVIGLQSPFGSIFRRLTGRVFGGFESLTPLRTCQGFAASNLDTERDLLIAKGYLLITRLGSCIHFTRLGGVACSRHDSRRPSCRPRLVHGRGRGVVVMRVTGCTGGGGSIRVSYSSRSEGLRPLRYYRDGRS